MAGSNLPPIIIKKVKKGHGDGHGSSTWKIALADFMTAMFIIFLCLWLINQTTPEQRTGIADYFSPASVSRTTSGSGGLLGGTTITVPGTMKSSTSPVSPQKGGGPSQPQEGEGTTQIPGYPGSTDQLRGTKAGGEQKGAGRGPGGAGGQQQQDQKLAEIKNAIQGIEGLPNAPVQNVTTQWVDEGLRIQLVDSDKRELFVRGSAQPLPQTKQLMTQVAKIIEKLPNKVEVAGYTDASPLGRGNNYTNWELSADRANAGRRLLVEAGVPDDRIAKVVGRADREPLLPEDPSAAGNRRISITLLRERSPEDVAAANAQKGADAMMNVTPSRAAPGPAPEGRLIPR